MSLKNIPPRKNNQTRMPRLLTVIFALILTSCVTGKRFGKIPLDQLDFVKTEESAPFRAVGKVKMGGLLGSFSGSLLLAAKGGLFRLEVIHKTGKTVFAAAGDNKKMVIINTENGSRKIYIGSRIPFIGPLKTPVELLQSLVTGKPPPFGKIKRAWRKDGEKVVHVEDPKMEFVFSNNLEKIRFYDADNGDIEILLGPHSISDIGGQVQSVEIQFKGGVVLIDWNRIEAVKSFPEGFFEFNELIDFNDIL